MNKKILLLWIYFITNIFLFADDNDKRIYAENYFTYSAVGNISTDTVDFYNPGITLGLESFLEWDKHSHLIGIDYRLIFFFHDEDEGIYHSLQWYYCFLPDFGLNDFIFFPLWMEIRSFPFGINMDFTIFLIPFLL